MSPFYFFRVRTLSLGSKVRIKTERCPSETEGLIIFGGKLMMNL